MGKTGVPQGAVKRPRTCLIHDCREMGRPVCCADCWQRDACLDRCLNWPSRCRCVGRSEAEYLDAVRDVLDEKKI